LLVRRAAEKVILRLDVIVRDQEEVEKRENMRITYKKKNHFCFSILKQKE
jgi:hypothetical protein